MPDVDYKLGLVTYSLGNNKWNRTMFDNSKLLLDTYQRCWVRRSDGDGGPRGGGGDEFKCGELMIG